MWLLKRKISTALDGQKPKRRKKKLPFLKLTSVFLIFSTALGLAYKSYIYLAQLHFVDKNTVCTRDLKLEVASVPPEDADWIKNQIDQAASKSCENSLEMLAASLLNASSFYSLDLVLLSPKHLYIKTQAVVPVLAIAIDTHFVRLAADGEIYGPVLGDKEGLIVLNDFFSKKALQLGDELILNPRLNRYVVDEKRQKYLLDALDILARSKNENLILDSMSFDRYRGFSGVLTETQISVLFGFGPFERKFDNLKRILISLKEKQLKAESIELDFKDKAFIKYNGSKNV